MAGELRAIECGDAPDAEVIDVLRGMLERAERGDIRAVAIAGVGRGGYSCTVYEHGGRALELLGALTVVRRRVEDVFAEGC